MVFIYYFLIHRVVEGWGVELLASSPNINCVSDREKVNFRVLEYRDLSYIYKPFCCTLFRLTFKMTLWLSEDPALDIGRWVHQDCVVSPWYQGQKGQKWNSGSMFDPRCGRTGLSSARKMAREHVLQKMHRQHQGLLPMQHWLTAGLRVSPSRPCHITPYPQ